VDTDQAVFGVILETLDAVAATALFAQPPKTVIAITLVLIHMHAVVLDQAVDPIAVEQVACRVVVEALDRRPPVHVLDLLDRVIAIGGTALIGLAGRCLVVKSPDQAVVIGRRGWTTTAWALGLGEYLGHQIVASVILIVLLQQRQYFAGDLLVVQRLLAEAAIAVVAGAGV